MKARFLPSYRVLAALALPLLFIPLAFWLASSTTFQQHPSDLSLGITLDLALTLPLLWFLLIRKTSIPNLTVVPLFILGIVTAGMILPTEQQFYLVQIKTWVLPLVELVVFSLVIYKVRKSIKAFKAARDGQMDFFETIKKASADLFPAKVSNAVAMEIACFYYAFFTWKKKLPQANQFTLHQRSGTPALLGVFIMIIGIETFAIHLLVQSWSVPIAWILSALSVYTGFQVFAQMKAMSRRFITLDSDRLILRYGIFAETIIALDQIEQVEVLSKVPPKEEGLEKLSPLGEMERPNVLITLKSEQILSGLYGMKKKYQKLALHVDDKARFSQALAAKINP